MEQSQQQQKTISAVQHQIENGFLSAAFSFGEGNSSKLCDFIADSIVDACIEQDQNAKACVDVSAKSGLICIMGEILFQQTAQLEIEDIARNCCKEVGFNNQDKGLNFKNVNIISTVEIVDVTPQKNLQSSSSIGQNSSSCGGGSTHQILQGYATDEWSAECLSPLNVHLAQKLCEYLSEMKKQEGYQWLLADNQAMVVLEYEIVEETRQLKPVRATHIVIQVHHVNTITVKEIQKIVTEDIIPKVIPESMLDQSQPPIIVVNQNGIYELGGPEAETGMSGNKISSDTYGEWCHSSALKLSGREPCSVQRAATYYCRYIAKTLVHIGLCHRVHVQAVLASSGLSEPLYIKVNSFGSARQGVTDSQLESIVSDNFNFTQSQMVKELRLVYPISRKTSQFGHFGKEDPAFTWEKPKQGLTGLPQNFKQNPKSLLEAQDGNRKKSLNSLSEIN